MPDIDTLATARDTLATAAALGMDLPAIPGTTVYWAYIDSFHDDIDLGLYTTRDSATRAIRSHVLEHFDDNPDDAPWTRTGQTRDTYLATATSTDLIEELYSPEDYTIQPLRIQA